MNKSIVDRINQIKAELQALAKQVRGLPLNPNVEQLGHNCISGFCFWIVSRPYIICSFRF
ncbi:unnamed protein product [marine sediment metagenome]|uniref:Uncharacterized protein n=1 Tax=marine sediment metagenome TaxID=412755 RepID=X1DRR7_9ZZZZ